MRTFAVPVIVLALLLAVSVWAGIWIRLDTERWAEKLDTLDTFPESGNWEEAEARVEAVYREWQQRQTMLHMIMEHQNLTETEKLFAGVFAACAKRDPVEFMILSRQLQTQILFLKETQQANLKNIF